MNASSVPGAVDVLVLAAYAPELSGLRALLGDKLYGNVNGLSVACKTVGVGLPNAASGSTLRLLQLRPRAVILVGTCGAYPQVSASFGDSVVARRIMLVATSEIERRGAIPEPMGRVIDCNPMIAVGLASGRAPTWDVANTLAITTDDALAARLGAGTGCAVENLEAFAVANASALQQIPFACVLGISNRVCSIGREEWRTHHRAAAQGACDIVLRWLRGGAAGLPHVS